MVLTRLSLVVCIGFGMIAGQKQERGADSQGRGCTVKVTDSPGLRGLRLGASSKEVLELFTGIRGYRESPADLLARPPNGLGFSAMDFRPTNYKGPNIDLSGIVRVSLEFLDDRVTAFEFEYVNSGHMNARQLATRIAEAAGLPSDGWRNPFGIELTGVGERVLDCADFSARVETSEVTMSAKLWDPSTAETVKRRREERDRKTREAFKP